MDALIQEVSSTAWPSESQLRELIAHFEAATLPKLQWTHAAHVAVGAAYVHRLGLEAAMNIMRDRVKRYNVSVGTANSTTSGYHETLTRMWLLVLDRLLGSVKSLDETSFVQLSVDRYIDRRDLYKQLYSFDVVASTFARSTWVPPDTAQESGIF